MQPKQAIPLLIDRWTREVLSESELLVLARLRMGLFPDQPPVSSHPLLRMHEAAWWNYFDELDLALAELDHMGGVFAELASEGLVARSHRFATRNAIQRRTERHLRELMKGGITLLPMAWRRRQLSVLAHTERLIDGENFAIRERIREHCPWEDFMLGRSQLVNLVRIGRMDEAIRQTETQAAVGRVQELRLEQSRFILQALRDSSVLEPQWEILDEIEQVGPRYFWERALSARTWLPDVHEAETYRRLERMVRHPRGSDFIVAEMALNLAERDLSNGDVEAAGEWVTFSVSRGLPTHLGTSTTIRLLYHLMTGRKAGLHSQYDAMDSRVRGRDNVTESYIPLLQQVLTHAKGHDLLQARVRATIARASGEPAQEEPEVPITGWVLQGLFAKGGQAEVWSAYHLTNRFPVVVKWILAGNAHLFRREVASLARLDHPHIVPIFDVLGVDRVSEEQSGHRLKSGSVGLVLARAQGVLSSQWPQMGTLNAVFRAVLQALGHAHSLGILHLDIKPENLLWSDNSKEHLGVWLTDFGYGLHGWGTKTNRTAGTLMFASPEQLFGRTEQLSPQTDFYQLARVFLFFMGERHSEDLALLRTQALVSQPDLSRVAPPWRPVFEWMLQSDVRERPLSAAGLLRVLPSTPMWHGVIATVNSSASTFCFQDDAQEVLFVDERPAPLPTFPAPSVHQPLPLAQSRKPYESLLRWRQCDLIGRDRELRSMWSTLQRVSEGEVSVVRVGGVGRGRRRLIEEFLARVSVSGAAISSSLTPHDQDTLATITPHFVANTALRATGRRHEHAQDYLATWGDLARSTLGWQTPLVLAILGSHSRFGYADHLVGLKGKIMLIVESEDHEIKPLTHDHLTQMAVKLAGLTHEAAATLTSELTGPGHLQLILSLLERKGQLRGPVGRRTIRGYWPASLPLLLKSMVHWYQAEEQPLIFQALEALAAGKQPENDLGLQICIREGWATEVRGRIICEIPWLFRDE